MQKGVVVLSGSTELGAAREAYPALFRRAACVCKVGPMKDAEVRRYLKSFLCAFTSLEEAKWDDWTLSFLGMDLERRPWSIDSLQQYLMQRITAAADSKIVEQVVIGVSPEAWKVRAGQEAAFLGMMQSYINRSVPEAETTSCTSTDSCGHAPERRFIQ